MALAGGVTAAPVHVLRIDNQIISPVTQRYIESGIGHAEEAGAACVVIVLDTPGGLLESTRDIVKTIMNARVPVAVFVAPPGSRAGSAGVFITLAAHIAAMAPSTNIGAAHPVGYGGSDETIKKIIRRVEKGEEPETKESDGATTVTRKTTSKGTEETVEEKRHSPMGDKVLNDTVAWMRAIARKHGRNEQWAVKAVTESLSIPADDALTSRVIDLIARDVPDLLQKIDGRAVDVGGTSVTLQTAGAALVEQPMNRIEQFLAIITHPNIAYILMMLGTLGLIFEFTHPGFGFPGIAGFICLILGLYSFQVLPVNYAAVVLMVAGLGLLVAEIKIASFGLLAIGGALCLTLGGLMLFQSPDPALRVSLSVVLPAVLTLVAITLFILHRAFKAFSVPVATGSQGMIGAVGEVETDLNPEGMVFVHGETWRARAQRPLARGTRVRVTKVEGLLVHVEEQ